MRPERLPNLARRSLVALALCIATACPAQQPTAPAELTQKLERLKQPYESETAELESKFRATNDEAEHHELIEKQLTLAHDAIGEAGAIADATAGTETAAKAWSFVLMNDWGEDKQLVARAFDTLLDKHFASPVWEDLAGKLANRAGLGVSLEKSANALRALMVKSPHKAVRASCMYELALRIAEREGEPRFAENIALLKRLKREFANVEEVKEYVADAGRVLFELERLQPGMSCPDFEATDEHGIKFKLSDYKGRAVLLEFGGYWLGEAQPGLAYDKLLVNRLADEPFALIDMNTDSGEPEKLTRRFKDDGLNWRHAILGPPNKAAIPTKWNVIGYPTLYLVDAKGIIRKYWLGGPGDETIDSEVDKLVAEAKAKK